MTEEERADFLTTIQNNIPEIVFERFCIILSQIRSTVNNNKLIEALGKICKNQSKDFCYVMDIGQSKDTITPIREVIDLLDGWIITAQSKIDGTIIQWEVNSILNEVK